MMNHRLFPMRRCSMWWRVAAFGLVLFPARAADAQVKDAPPYLKGDHREVIEKWLASNLPRASLRIATERDCRNKAGLAAARQENRNYQPYYAVGDFNHDGIEDFAVAFIDERKRRNKFSMAIFNGPLRSRSAPAYLLESTDLGMMGFSWHSGQQNYLLLGEFQSDFCSIFKPRGKSYRGQDCLSE